MDEDRDSPTLLESLTWREKDVLRLLAEGQSNREIAQALSLELTTVKWYNKQIFDKLGASSRQKAVLQVQKLGLLDDHERPEPASHIPSHNLPAQITSFIGREREVAEVLRLLGDAHLLTLTGPPGTGKTRLALRVASKIADANTFPDGICFVDLAPVTTPDLVAGQIAGALGMHDSSGGMARERLFSYLSDKQMLLLVDNYEHVIKEALLMAELLSHAPGLKILVTSRESLQVYGEQQYPVPPLALPELDRPFPPSLEEIESVALFLQRARAVKPGFLLTDENASAVAEICVQLDGIPLALELAAARVKVFSPRVLSDQLSNRFAILQDGFQGLPEHQRTLYRAIEWSYELLTDGEKTLFARLSAFQGGRSIEAAQEVCGHDLSLNVLNGLESLVIKSLLYTMEGAGGELRFLYLESIHEFARAMLDQRGETSDLRHRHTAYFASLAERAEPHLSNGPEQMYWLLRLDDDHDNLRAALEWSLDGADVEQGIRLARSLVDFWQRQGFIMEGWRWTQRALEAVGDFSPRLRAPLLFNAGMMAYFAGESGNARQVLEEALRLYRTLGDQRGAGETLGFMGLLSLGRPQEYEAAVALIREGLALLREVNDRSGIANTLTNLGELTRMQGDFATARKANLESLDIVRELGATFREWVHYNNLALIALQEGDAEGAQAWTQQFLIPALEVGHRYAITSGLHLMAGVASLKGFPERSACLIGAAEALDAAHGIQLQPSDILDYARIEEAIRRQLSAQEFEAVYAQGRAMTLEEAAAYALANPSDP